MARSMKNRNSFRPQLEAFEDRLALSTLIISGGNLVFNAKTNVDHDLLVYRSDAGNYTFTDTSSELIELTGNTAGATGDGSQLVRIPGASVTGTITINLLKGNDRLNVASTNHPIIANMGDGNDRFLVGVGAITNPITVNGGDGSDWLDYSNWAGPVRATVNGTASKIANMTKMENLVGGARADILTGDVGGNILMGLGGNDILSGAGGNDLIIGGDGGDTLSGGVGFDLLIGGMYKNDSSTSATGASLQQIENEWQLTDATTYTQRVGHIRNGGGANGQNKLDATTVTNDNFVDTLSGGTTELDWFFADLTDPIVDTLTDWSNPEQRN